MKKVKIVFGIILFCLFLYVLYQFFLIFSGRKMIQFDKGMLFSITFDKSSYKVGEKITGKVVVWNMSLEEVTFKKCSDSDTNIFVEMSEPIERFYTMSGGYGFNGCGVETENFNRHHVPPFYSKTSTFYLEPLPYVTDKKLYVEENLDLNIKFDKGEVFMNLPIEIEKTKEMRKVPSSKKDIIPYIWKHPEIKPWLEKYDIAKSDIKEDLLSYSSIGMSWHINLNLNDSAEKASGFRSLNFIIDKDSGEITQAYAHKLLEGQDDFIFEPITLSPYFKKELEENKEKMFTVSMVPKEKSKDLDKKMYLDTFQNKIKNNNGEIIEFNDYLDIFTIQIKGKDLLELDSLKLWRSIEKKEEKK